MVDVIREVVQRRVIGMVSLIGLHANERAAFKRRQKAFVGGDANFFRYGAPDLGDVRRARAGRSTMAACQSPGRSIH
jgi:hypothetical protein